MADDLISRQAAIDAIEHITSSMSVCINTDECHGMKRMQRQAVIELANLPSEQPERKWIPCSNPPKHHRDVLVRGKEAIGNVTVHKVMQWDVDVWRPTNYAPSIIWEEWSEI